MTGHPLSTGGRFLSADGKPRRLIDVAYILREGAQIGRAERRPDERIVPANMPRETGWKPYDDLRWAKGVAQATRFADVTRGGRRFLRTIS